MFKRVTRRPLAPEQDELIADWTVVETPIAEGPNVWATAPTPGTQLVIGGLSVQRVESNTATTVFTIRSGLNGPKRFRFETSNSDNALFVIFPPGARIILRPGDPFVVEASAANEHHISAYIIEDKADWKA